MLQKTRSSSFWDVSGPTSVGSYGLPWQRYLQVGPIRWPATSVITDLRWATPLKSEGLIYTAAEVRHYVVEDLVSHKTNSYPRIWSTEYTTKIININFKLKMQFFWSFTLRRLVNSYWRFGGSVVPAYSWFRYSTANTATTMEAIQFSKTSVTAYLAVRNYWIQGIRYNPQVL